MERPHHKTQFNWVYLKWNPLDLKANFIRRICQLKSTWLSHPHFSILVTINLIHCWYCFIVDVRLSRSFCFAFNENIDPCVPYIRMINCDMWSSLCTFQKTTTGKRLVSITGLIVVIVLSIIYNARNGTKGPSVYSFLLALCRRSRWEHILNISTHTLYSLQPIKHTKPVKLCNQPTESPNANLLNNSCSLSIYRLSVYIGRRRRMPSNDFSP